MTLPWSSSTYKQISLDRQSLLCHMPDALQKSLVRAWEHHYEELYESEADGTVLLEEVLEEILHSFEGCNQTLKHIRYVWMALILACTVEPTVKYYQPNNPDPEATINHLTDWLLVNIREIFHDRSPLIRASIGKVNNTSVNVCNLYSEKKISHFQGLSEALGVYISAIKTLEANCAVAALLDILDDCLEGYAIFPGSYGRRELFNWWLWDVVPSTWYLFPPNSLYSLDKLNNEQNRLSLNRLKEISGNMWDIILPVTQGKKNSLAAQ